VIIVFIIIFVLLALGYALPQIGAMFYV
jgi:hypothetical protein